MGNLREVFETALQENRYDSSTRLVFADWLEENDFPDEAAEQRRRASPAWIEADKWMHQFAARGGVHIVNYGQAWPDLDERRRGLDFSNPLDLDELNRVQREERERQIIEPITYEQCIQAGLAHLKDGDYFVQMGSEGLRDLMYEEGETWWKNWSVITGVPLPNQLEDGFRDAPFDCSC